MRTHFNLFFFIFIIGSLMPLNAAIHGVVLDEQGNPLTGANVWWAGTTEGATTNMLGEFHLHPVRQTKQLVNSFIGYRNDTTTVAGSEPLTIVLFPEDEHLDEVTVSARSLSSGHVTPLSIRSRSGRTSCARLLAAISARVLRPLHLWMCPMPTPPQVPNRYACSD